MRNIVMPGAFGLFLTIISSFSPVPTVIKTDNVVYKPIYVVDSCLTPAFDSEVYMSRPYGLPIEETNLNKPLTQNSGFGMRFHPILKINRMHKGFDFSAPVSTPIVSTLDGVVTHAGRRGGYGNLVVIEAKDYEVRFAHCSEILVEEGEWISRGTVVGLVGTSGLSTGPHLHYEILYKGKHIDPLELIL